jgi:hypothetical protein
MPWWAWLSLGFVCGSAFGIFLMALLILFDNNYHKTGRWF